MIVGIEFLSSSPVKPFLSVDPNTGSTTPFGVPFSTGFYATSSSPYEDNFFAATADLYLVNPFTGQRLGYLCLTTEDCRFSASEYAYDPANQTLYGLRENELVRIVDLGPLSFGAPGERHIKYVFVGNMGVTLSVVEYVPGFGLYGTDGSSAYRIDETTGQATFLYAFTGVPNPPPITGLAYDPDTATLIATFGMFSDSNLGEIFRLDPATGILTLLNSRSENLYDIAYMRVSPEITPALMMAAGLSLLVAFRRILV
jgi:hypothetical protein